MSGSGSGPGEIKTAPPLRYCCCYGCCFLVAVVVRFVGWFVLFHTILLVADEENTYISRVYPYLYLHLQNIDPFLVPIQNNHLDLALHLPFAFLSHLSSIEC